MRRTMLQSCFLKTAVLLMLAALGGTGQTPPQFKERNPRYQLGRGDVLDINFPRTPEFTQTVTVEPDGFVSLRGAGDLHVLGLTVPGALEAIRAAYATILHDAAVTIELKDFEKPYFTSFGEISKPGRYELRGDITVTQALAISGGFREGAKDSEVLLLRRYSAELTEVKRVPVKQMLRAGNLREDPYIQPGDILFVPKSLFGKIERFIPNSSIGAMMKPY
jgi:protein involved in polysaccharide export with SLBB domain